MIKFFRHIRKSLIEQNKMGKYMKYAIGEIILVMIGILLALQVSNWNQNRLNRMKEKSILNSIHNEFKANQTQFDTVVFYHNKVRTNCQKLIDMFPIDVERDNLDSISTYLQNSLFSWTFNPSQGTLNGIINSSSFDLIENDELRETLVSWQDLLLDLQEDEIYSKNVVYNQIDPFLAPHIDFNIDLTDKRNNIKIFESLHFEYMVKLKMATLDDIFDVDGELIKIKESLDRIVELTKP